MTATPRTDSYDPTLHRTAAARPQRRGAGEAALSAEASRDRLVFRRTMLVVAALFLLLQNPYWVPAGDSEVYISVARNIALGRGYEFNGQPVAMVPPGWPAAMAAVMKLTPYFLPLKLLAMGCMLGALAMAYWVCRRFVSPGWASITILSTAVITHVYQSTFWLISEGLFCLFSTAALLLAMQIREGRGDADATPGWRRRWRRVALLMAMCALAVTVRWAGILGMLLVAGILLDGQWKPRVNRQWIAVVLAGMMTLGTFMGLREALEAKDTVAGTLPADLSGGGAGEETGPAPPALTDRFVTQQYAIITGTASGGSYVGRFIGWGRWVAWLFWQPVRAGANVLEIDVAAHALGWVVIFLILVAAGWGVARRQWIWLTLLMYCGALALNWPNPNARYLVPVSFLLIVGVIRSAEVLRTLGNAIWGRAMSAGVWTFIGSIVLCNVVLWGIEVSVQRSVDFYAAYEGGVHQTIIAPCRFLASQNLADGQIAVTPVYQNMGRRRPSQYALRATTMLTDRAIISLPKKWQIPPSTRLARWLERNGVRYYLHQNPFSPWRIWHFRVPRWQEKVTGKPVEEIEAGWRLYRITPGIKSLMEPPGVPTVPGAWLLEVPPALEPVPIRPSRHWPTRVPGL